ALSALSIAERKRLRKTCAGDRHPAAETRRPDDAGNPRTGSQVSSVYILLLRRPGRGRVGGLSPLRDRAPPRRQGAVASRQPRHTDPGGHIGALARVSGGKESSCEQWRRSCPDRTKGRRRGGRGGDLPMKAVVYRGPREVAVEEVDDPRIADPTDVIVRITSTAICGSDLHMYEGRTD